MDDATRVETAARRPLRGEAFSLEVIMALRAADLARAMLLSRTEPAVESLDLWRKKALWRMRHPLPVRSPFPGATFVVARPDGGPVATPSRTVEMSTSRDVVACRCAHRTDSHVYDAATKFLVPPEPAKVPRSAHTRKRRPDVRPCRSTCRTGIKFDTEWDQEKAAFDEFGHFGEERREALHCQRSSFAADGVVASVLQQELFPVHGTRMLLAPSNCCICRSAIAPDECNAMASCFCQFRDWRSRCFRLCTPKSWQMSHDHGWHFMQPLELRVHRQPSARCPTCNPISGRQGKPPPRRPPRVRLHVRKVAPSCFAPNPEAPEAVASQLVLD